MKSVMFAAACALAMGGTAFAGVHENITETAPDTVRIAYSNGWGGIPYGETSAQPIHPDDVDVAPERAGTSTLCRGNYVKTRKGVRMLLVGADAKGARSKGAWIMVLKLDGMISSAEYAETGKGDFHEFGFALAEIHASVFTECPKTLLKKETGETRARLQLLGTMEYIYDVVKREKLDFVDPPAPKKRPKRR